MPNVQSMALAASGLVSIASGDPHDQGPYGWQVQFRPSAFGGFIVLYQDATNPGSIVTRTTSNLTAIAWTDANSNAIAAGTPITFTTDMTASVVITVNTSAIAGLFANVVWYAGSLAVNVTPNYVAPASTVNFSTVVVDAIPYQWDDNFEFVLAAQDAGNLTDA